MLIQFMHWWPKPEHGIWGFFSPVPAFGTTAVPIMFLIDWYIFPLTIQIIIADHEPTG